MNDATNNMPAPAAVSTRFVGASALTMLFIASGIFTFASLSPDAPPPAQVAAAAAAEPDPFEGLTVRGKSAYVYDLSDDTALFSYNADAQLPLASITKVMLALVVSEALSPDATISVPAHNTPDGSPKRIPDNSTWRMGDLLDFTLVSSSNEGAEILAAAADEPLRRKFAASLEGSATVNRMNELAREIGLEHTYFLNASGLDASPTQSGAYGSSRDVAKMFAYAMHAAPELFEGTAESGLLRISQEGDRASAVNTDKALGEIPGIIMGKTGLTDLAGGNFAVVFDAGLAHPIVAVVLGSTDRGRFEDMKLLVAAAQDAVARR